MSTTFAGVGRAAGSAGVLRCAGGQCAEKGVFFTTSTFTPQALDFVRSVERIALVTGEQMAG